MNKSLQVILANYKNCLFYNESRLNSALNGDVIEISNIGTDFARSQMFTEAIECWEFIVQSNMPTNPETYNNLGVSYYYGNGVEVNYEKAVHYYQKAAAAGHPLGKYNLAVALENGNGIECDIERAIKYYTMAAENGVNQAIDALIRLGVYNELKLAYYQRNLNDDSFLGDDF